MLCPNQGMNLMQTTVRTLLAICLKEPMKVRPITRYHDVPNGSLPVPPDSDICFTSSSLLRYQIHLRSAASKTLSADTSNIKFWAVNNLSPESNLTRFLRTKVLITSWNLLGSLEREFMVSCYGSDLHRFLQTNS
jgi:hypothetical protein